MIGESKMAKAGAKKYVVLAVILAIVVGGLINKKFPLFARLRLVPDRVSLCQPPTNAIEVHWQAPRKVPVVNIYVYDVGQKPRLWLSAGNSGRQRTGEWLGDGSTVELTDAQGRVLAKRTLTSKDCEMPSGS